MMLETARMEDLEAICALYESTCAQMQAAGLNQWSWGEYPSRDIVREDLEAGRLYVARQGGAPICAVAIDQEQEEQYARVDWLFGTRPGSFHRFAVAGELRGQGLGRKVLGEIIQILQGMGCDSLRCDTSAENAAALHLYESQGMRRAGAVHYPPDLSQDYPCLEMPLTADCPLLPIPMTPAFRGGSLTPWGGKKLREVYGKKIPNDTTGESLEVSCIPGLESADPMGVKLPELIARYGEKLVGAYAGETFPLLLKLLDARESLSVQVHPGDAYAHEHENGKLGKTEAWLILRAEPGSELVYGIVPGTELERLRSACLAGAAVQPLLRRVAVKPGDVCFIPAGCVHAIGEGIMLYEIQQSSDVTYRFYDWDRVDAKGNKRELHLDKALDVTDLHFALDPVPAPDAPCARVLDTTYFTLDLLKAEGQVEVPPVKDFGLLTALDDLTLRWEGGERALAAGQSLLLPAACPALTLEGRGRAALSMPAGKQASSV